MLISLHIKWGLLWAALLTAHGGLEMKQVTFLKHKLRNGSNYDFVFTGAPDCTEEKMNWGPVAHLTLSVPALLVSRGSEGADSFSTERNCPNYKSRVLCSRHSQKEKENNKKLYRNISVPVNVVESRFYSILLLSNGIMDQGHDVIKPRIWSRDRIEIQILNSTNKFAFGDSKLCLSYIDVNILPSLKVEV